MHEGQKLGPMRPQASVGHFAGEQQINRCVIGPTFMEQAVSCDIFKCWANFLGNATAGDVINACHNLMTSELEFTKRKSVSQSSGGRPQ